MTREEANQIRLKILYYGSKKTLERLTFDARNDYFQAREISRSVWNEIVDEPKGYELTDAQAEDMDLAQKFAERAGLVT
ncbi:MAG: hypothetical protein WC322_03370 [Candidatus Paceibacterota bacterium]|jgi:hypothetical protein